MKFNDVYNILLSSNNRYVHLKQKWIEEYLRKLLSQQVSDCYLEMLSLNICNKL
jgi:hypothetical protein